MRRSVITLLAACVALGAPSASATAPERVSVAVSYNDLDLTGEAGNATLNARIEAAVKQVCAKPGVRELKAMNAWAACQAAARQSVRAQLSALEPRQTAALASRF